MSLFFGCCCPRNVAHVKVSLTLRPRIIQVRNHLSGHILASEPVLSACQDRTWLTRQGPVKLWPGPVQQAVPFAGYCSRSDIYSFGMRFVLNTLRPRQNGRHFADDIFKCIFLNENIWIPIKNSLKFVPRGPINNISTLVQIMAWCRSGDKPLSESMLVSLLWRP